MFTAAAAGGNTHANQVEALLAKEQKPELVRGHVRMLLNHTVYKLLLTVLLFPRWNAVAEQSCDIYDPTL